MTDTDGEVLDDQGEARNPFARQWDVEPEPAEPPPLVLVSSRDGKGDPAEVDNRSAAWRGLSKRAEGAGWAWRITYALAWKQAKIASTGRVTKAAHHVHTIALRLTRDGLGAFAVWSAESTDPEPPRSGWSFSVAGAGRVATKDKRTWTEFVCTR